VRVWRLCQAERVNDSLRGEGGAHTSGRWHHRGARIVYTSATLSLAALEVLVHVSRAFAPADLVAVELDIPEGLEIGRVPPSRLPSGWDANPAPIATQDLGTSWAASRRTPVLEVPSAIIPRECNYLLNPQHPRFARIRIVGRTPFSFDTRLLG
jgi:RES domain-containing protein